MIMWVSKTIIMIMMIIIVKKWHMDVVHKPPSMMPFAFTAMSVLVAVPEPFLDMGMTVPVLWDPVPGSRTC
tara:strand:- start:684 stop:896 length:213 start_codon:yes stop_codon:yes gene_type:complete